MKEIPLTQGKVAIVSNRHYEYLTRWNWYYHHTGYAVRHIYRGDGSGHLIYMHHEVLPRREGFEIDHKNRNKLDNRDENLRLATSYENARNHGVRSDNSSGYIGVCWNKKLKKWAAYIRVEGKRRHLLYWNSAKEAANAYDKAAKELFGEFSVLNHRDTPEVIYNDN